MAQNNILLVDDSRSVRSRISVILSEAGYNVIVAEDGREGLRLLQDHKIDLIISDLEMPFVNGLELCQTVKSDEHLHQIYFILLTARAEIGSRVQGLETGADDYIVKTTHQDEFIARVRAGLRVRELERKLQRSQAHLFHSEKMASIGQLAAGLAHEINNPVGFIISNLGSLEKYISRLTGFITAQKTILESAHIADDELCRLTEQYRRLKIDQILDDSSELIAESREGAERIASIVANLRNFLDIETYECKLTDLNQALDLTISLVLLEFKELDHPRKNFGEIPPTRCYSHQMNQVFANLVRNAAQAVANGGEITVSSYVEQSDIMVTIADTGCGIAAEHLNRIYDPFFTTREVGQGAGLGLTISDDIVRKHGGSIMVNSRVGEGTVFTLRLPVQP